VIRAEWEAKQKTLGFPRRQRVHTGVATIHAKEHSMKPTRAILTHSNYDADDYAYLTAKGWSDDEILARWSEEAAHGNGPCHWESASARAKLAAVTGRQQAMRED
jgi:hypothetical protein